MKPFILLLIPVLFSLSALGAETKTSAKKDEKETYAGIAVNEDPTLKRMLSDAEVKPVYDKCKKDIPELSKIPDCIWKGLSPDKQKQMTAIYAEEKKVPSRLPASDLDVPKKDKPKTNFTAREYILRDDYKNNPQVKALEALYGQKLEEVLGANDPKDPGGSKKIKTVSHSKFIELYASELGKSIINAFTSYCLDVDVDACKTDKLCKISSEDDAKKYREKNLESLKTASLKKEDGDKWTHCIATVPKVCDESSNGSNDYAKHRACIVMDFVDAARKGLMAADEQKEFYKKLNTGIKISDGRENKYENVDEKLSTDQLALASADLDKKYKGANDKETTLEKVNEGINKEAGECIDENGTTIKDEKKCSKFVDKDKNKDSDAFLEFGLKAIAKEKAIDEAFSKDQSGKSVESFLLEEGFKKEEIAAMLKDPNALESVKKKIQERYKAKKEAIIEEMAAKIKKKTTEDDGKIANSDSSKIKTVKAELSERSQDLKNLIHFNNIVSSYISIENTTGDKKNYTRNTASLFAEMKGTKDKKEAEDLKNKIKDAGLKEEKNNAELKVQDLNANFMNYQESKKDSDKTNGQNP